MGAPQTTPTSYGDIGTMNYMDPGTNIRGNLTRRRSYPNVSSQGVYIDHTSTYDVAGNVLTAQLNCCQTRSWTYPSSYFYAYPSSVTSGSGPTLSSSAEYDVNTGLVTRTTAENSQVRSFYYLIDSLKPEHVESGGVHVVSYNYSDTLTPDVAGRGHYFVVTNTRLDAIRVTQSYHFFDGLGALTQSFDNRTDANGWSTQDIEYDVMGQAYRVSNPYYSGGYAWDPINPDGYWTTNTFDNLGRVTQITMPTGDSSPTSLTNVQSSYAGTVSTVTDQANKQRRQIVDALGRVIRLDEPDSSGNLGLVGAPSQPTYYDYDPLDNLIHITQGSQHRYFKYDSMARLTFERQVEQDAPHAEPDVATGNNYWSRKIVYNSHSQATDVYDARQIRTQIGYDGLNRILNVSYSGENPAVTPNVTYTYDQSWPGFFNQGQLTTVTTASLGSTPQTTHEFDYDIFARIASHRQKIGATTYTMGYSIDIGGELLSQTYPSGRVLNYVYDEGGRLTNVNDGVTTYANGLTYKAHGGLASETFGNSFLHTMDYNSRLQPSQVKLSLAGAEKQRFDYAYGKVDQGTGTVDKSKNNGQLGRIDGFINGARQWDQRFSYDPLGRLAQATEYRADNGSLTYQAYYDYDIYGNRLQYQNNVNLVYTTVQPTDIEQSPNRNRFKLTGPTPVSYDAAGNMTMDAKFRLDGQGIGMNYSYDANNRQILAKRTNDTNQQTAVYDAVGQRVRTIANGATRVMIYDAFGKIISEYKNGPLERENIYRGGELLAVQEAIQAGPQNVVWTNAAGVTVSGNTLTKTAATGWANAGASSAQSIVSGDGYVEYTATDTDYSSMVGLTHTDSDMNYVSIDFAIFPQSGVVSVYESGVSRGSFGSFVVGDKFRVSVEGGVVKYRKNGTLVYTSTVSPTYPLVADASLYLNGRSVSNAVISVMENEAISWTNAAGVTVSGNTLTKTAATGWANAGASSAQSIVSGDGYVEYTATDTDYSSMVGLTHTDSDMNYVSIDFAIFPQSGVVSVYESGVSRGSFGNYVVGDKFRVSVEGGVVKYRKNGTLVYTSTVSPTYPLVADASLYLNGRSVSNAVISGNLSIPVSYVLQDIQGSTRAVMRSNQITARHDFLPFGEELGAGTGLRTTAQGYGATDKIRQRYGLTERDDTSGLDHTWWRKYENLAGRWTSADPYRGSMGVANPQSFNRYAYVGNDPVNLADPTGLEAPLVCLVDGIQVNCVTAFNLVHSGAGVFGPVNMSRWDSSARMGAGEWQFYRSIFGQGSGWFNLAGVSIDIHSWVNGEYAGGASYYESFGTYSFGGNPFVQIGPNRPTGSERRTPDRPKKRPCRPTGSGDIGGELITPVLLGPRAGVQLDDAGAYPYWGLAAGTVGKGVSITAGTRPVTPGISIGFSVFAVVGFSFQSGDLTTLGFRNALRQGSWHFGGGTPGASANITVTHYPPRFMRRIWACE